MPAMKSIILAAALFLGAHGLAQAAADPAQFTLTPALLAKLKAAEPDFKRIKPSKDDDDDGKDNLSVEEYAKKIDAVPGAKAVLAKHGLNSLELALASHAMLHAGMHLMFEPSMGKANAAKAYAGYTAVQKANIELLRKHPDFMKPQR